MTYLLGVDVGTSYTAAATWRCDGQPQHKAEVLPLGNRSAAVASVLFLNADGSVVVGDAAERRALTDPDRVVREFKRRIGDDTPLFVGGQPYAAHQLAAMMVRWVVDRVTEREGGPPERIAITHPAGWGPYKKDLLRAAVGALGLPEPTLLAEPEAAAVNYAAQERIEPGATIAVYDLGGGTFDAAVVRKTGAGSFTLLGSPEGLEQLGGADFDEAVFAHVQAALAASPGTPGLDALDVEDPSTLSGLARLRRECIEAKEALSADTEASIPVLLPGITTQVRLVRSEFEEMIRPALEDTVDSLCRAIRSAGLTPADLGAVLLVGGSSRVPLVSQLVSARLGLPVVTDADPKTTIALGAALSLGTPEEPPAPTLLSPTLLPPTVRTPAPVPSTTVPSTTVPSTAVPSTAVPSTAVPPTLPVSVPEPVFPATRRFAPAPDPGAGPGQVPGRPPVTPAPRRLTERAEEVRSPAGASATALAPAPAPARRRRVGGVLFTMIMTGLVLSALLLLPRVVPQFPTLAGVLRGELTSGTEQPAVVVPGAGDRDKTSTAGSLGDSRGRQDAPVAAVPVQAPAPVGEPTTGPTTADEDLPDPVTPPPAPITTRPAPTSNKPVRHTPLPLPPPPPAPTTTEPEPTLGPTPEPSPEPTSEPEPSPTPPPSEQPPPTEQPPPAQPPGGEEPPPAQPPAAQPPSDQPPSGSPPTGPGG